jgi:hypothetical protein
MPETARHKLPLLAVSQAQKEITHNEALIRIDALLDAVAQAELATPPVLTDADIGKCWLIGASPSGDWAGKHRQLAVWIGGSWRFCSPAEGMQLRLQSSGTDRVYSAGSWVTAPTIPDPSNGTVIDIEARQAIASLLAYLRSTGKVTS